MHKRWRFLPEMSKSKFRNQDSSIAESDYNDYSAQICRELIQLLPTMIEGPIASFMALEHEPDLSTFHNHCFKQDIPVYVPRFDSDLNHYVFDQITETTTFKPQKFQVQEPENSPHSLSINEAQKHIKSWLVPGKKFDKFGHRLGHGYGWYDQFLEQASSIHIGVCFSSNISSLPLPQEDHDIRMSLVITNAQVYSCQG